MSTPFRTVAVDLGGTSTKLALVEDGVVREFRQVPAQPSRGLLDCLDSLATLVDERWGTVGQVSGWGISFPGIVDPFRKKVLATAGKYPDATEADLAAWAQRLGLPFVVENDANAALAGEVSGGCARGETDVVLCILGTGIGTAVRMGGKVLRGAHFQAGVLGGHFKTGANGSRCSCGGLGCWEARASTWALPALAGDLGQTSGFPLPPAPWTGFQALFDDHRRGDPLARSLVRALEDEWARGMATLVHAYDPSTVILTGGVLGGRDCFFDSLGDKILRSVWTPWGTPEIRVPDDPRASVLLGLNSLLKEALGWELPRTAAAR